MRSAACILCLLFAPTVMPETRLDLLRADAASGAFAQVIVPRAFEFPRDHGPHPDYRHEWWYTTGHLDAASGERFGFEVTFFRYSLAPAVANSKTSGASAWRTSQVYLAHFAITDLERGKFEFAERYSRDALGLAGAQSQPLRVWLEDWALQGAKAGWQLRAASDRYALDLDVWPVSPPVANGNGGLSRKAAAPGAASYYYSIPRMAVRGRLLRDGKPLEVQGTAWLDREWGSGSLASNQQGWDWFALQFQDGSALMFYAIRRNDGSRDPYSAGTWIAADGRASTLGNGEVQIDVLDRWNSPRGGSYPARWRLRVALLNLDMEIRPELADQELMTRPRYWEGMVEVVGWRGRAEIGGRGYVELVGYVGEGSTPVPVCDNPAVSGLQCFKSAP